MSAGTGPLPPADIFSLAGRTAVVTGASSGLGERFARVLHAAGANVVVGARRMERLEELAAGLERCVAVRCDVADEGDRAALVDEAMGAFGRIDVLVNNAGIGIGVPVEEETVEDFRRVLEVNTTAVWHLSKLAGVHMVAAGSGSIVNVASILGIVGSAPVKQANYCASKGAVVNLSRELALQWARKGVRVNSLCPGWFPSELTAGMADDEGSRAFIARNSPIPRMGHVNELDGAILFLASDASTFYTGQELVVDGGWTAR